MGFDGVAKEINQEAIESISGTQKIGRKLLFREIPKMCAGSLRMGLSMKKCE
jgi:hypothetical protein